MQLATYIKDLLYRYECVIIPGFGAFLTQAQSARIEGQTHTFYPPMKTLSFNRQLQANDGVLANYVASAEKCSYELALQKIRTQTGKWALELAERKTVSLRSIGDLSLDQGHRLQFIPSNKENFNTEAFGLAPFVAAAVTRENVASVSAETITAYEDKKKTAYPFMRYAAIGLLAITLGAFSGLKIYEGQVEKHNFAEKQKADSLIENRIQEATFVIDNPLPALNISIPKQSGKYHIVAGAFRIEANAEKKINQLVTKGYAARSIGKNRFGLHQVVYQSVSERQEALKVLRQIKRTENSDAWLLVQELK